MLCCQAEGYFQWTTDLVLQTVCNLFKNVAFAVLPVWNSDMKCSWMRTCIINWIQTPSVCGQLKYTPVKQTKQSRRKFGYGPLCCAQIWPQHNDPQTLEAEIKQTCRTQTQSRGPYLEHELCMQTLYSTIFIA